ncbi:DUF3375 domain-containing protein [Actinomyces culturomici]|uniref:DUF3375 domain-containing protein n=1 Tax=Actinomyces culturomici TaxID=1926276 RepID=UPI00135C12D5|nr:DUF3375 domain-containing protein [Actinomyces culturomici]
MSAIAHSLRMQRQREDSPVLALMRQPTMPVVFGILLEHLGGNEASLPAAELYSLVDDDLDELRRHGFELPGTAQHYCMEWVKAGYLMRRPAPIGKGEIFELSAPGHEAIRFLERILAPRAGVSESRLASILSSLERLATDTDDSISARLRALEAERTRIDRQIEATRRGEFTAMNADSAAAFLTEVLADARDVPSDFARVRDAMERLGRELRIRLIDDDLVQGDVLDSVFRGMDEIRESPEWRSFNAFYSLLMDDESHALFEDAVARILTRDFISSVDLDEVDYLRDYYVKLRAESFVVARSMSSFSRSLRQFAQSRQFEEFRELSERIRRAQRAGLDAAPVLRLHDHMQASIELTSPEMLSVGRLSLHVPSEVQAEVPIESAPPSTIDWEALRASVREYEIDFDELTDHVRRTLDEDTPASIGGVLQRFPATQGLASVIGLHILGQRHGTPIEAGEDLEWTWQGVRVEARMTPSYFFEEAFDGTA